MVTLPFSVREGINIFLAGFVPTENLRFRDESLTFKVTFELTTWYPSSMMELCSYSCIFTVRLLKLKKVLRRLRHINAISTPP